MNFEADPDPKHSTKEIRPGVDENFPFRFGMVAIRLGYITPDELRDALLEQVTEDPDERAHRTIGIILYDHGLMTMAHLHHTVSEMEKLLQERDRTAL